MLRKGKTVTIIEGFFALQSLLCAVRHLGRVTGESFKQEESYQGIRLKPNEEPKHLKYNEEDKLINGLCNILVCCVIPLRALLGLFQIFFEPNDKLDSLIEEGLVRYIVTHKILITESAFQLFFEWYKIMLDMTILVIIFIRLGIILRRHINKEDRDEELDDQFQ